MKTLQIGKAKSGNYWLYKIFQYLYESQGIEQKSYIKQHPIYVEAKEWKLSHSDQASLDVIDIVPDGIYFRIADKYREIISNLDSYLNQCTHAWTHSMYCDQMENEYQKFDKLVYIIRDPRDVVLSMARFAFTSYVIERGTHNEKNQSEFIKNRLYGSTISWVHHVGSYLKRRDDLNIHFIFYERLLYDFKSEINRLNDYLGFVLTSKQMNHLQEVVSLSSMKDKNPNHVQKGKAYGWIDILSLQQKEQIIRIAGPMLDILNYPTGNQSNSLRIPYLDSRINISDIDNAIQMSRGRLLDRLLYAYHFLQSRIPIRVKFLKGIRFLSGQTFI